MKKQVERIFVVSKYRDENGYEYQFSDDDIVDIGEWYPRGDYNPHNRRPFLLHDHGFTVCVVFADSLQEALDAAVDANKMDRYLISDKELREDYQSGEDERITYLGNAGEPFDIETLGVVELPNPPMSFCAIFNSQCPGK